MAPGDSKARIPAWQRAGDGPVKAHDAAEPAQAQAQSQAEPQAHDGSSPAPAARAADDEQQETPRPGEEEAQRTENSSDSAGSSSSSSAAGFASVQQHAAAFLGDASIRDAPRDRKLVFLRSKGLSDQEIELLLSAQQQASPQTNPHAETPSSPARRDIPPVITYPEFLLHSTKPPPLVTKSRLLNTAYATAALYTTLYALSTYIVSPLQAQLATARHDFLTDASHKLDALNARLSTSVSTLPASHSGTSHPLPASASFPASDNDNDSDSDADPTELFHRDIGTQTSPPRSRRASASSLPPPTPALAASARLTQLSTALRDLAASASSADAADSASTTELAALSTHLSQLALATSGYHSYVGAGGYDWSSAGLGTAGSHDKNDEIERMGREIKALKGRFLGVKNFPRVLGRVG